MSQSGAHIDAGRWRSPLLAFAGAGGATALSWFFLVRMGADAGHGCLTSIAMPASLPNLPAQVFGASTMWCIMMVAMMLPTALPAMAVFDNLARRRALQTGATTPTGLYAVGYVAAWTAYSVVAAVGQIALARAALLTPMLQSASVALSAFILLTAGLFQFSALKDACLSKCRTPFAYFLAEWRDGMAGALRLGFKHGGYCVGCCWAVMAVMFVVGAMNLIWMGALTLFMLGEKIAPARFRVREVSGVVLVLWGLVVASALLA